MPGGVGEVVRSAPGSRGRNGATARPRLEDVAAGVGLSTASVSLVLRGVPGPSERTRQRVLKATAELGYRTAGALAGRTGPPGRDGRRRAPGPGSLRTPRDRPCPLAGGAGEHGSAALIRHGESTSSR